MIAYMELPLSGTHTVDGHDILVIALAVVDNQNVICVYVDQDGSMGRCSLADVNVNWRFDDNRRKWVDVDTGEDLEASDGNG